MYRQLELDLSPGQVVAYLRKSQSDDPLLTVEEVLSKHEAILDEWAEQHLGSRLPPENKFFEVASGETLKDRPEINRLLRLIESPKYKAVNVVEPQRLTRGDLEDIGRLMKLLKHTNTLIITPQRIYDLHDEYDWDAFERELKRGNDYLEYTKKILNRGRLLSVSQGNFIGSRPPYGYDRDWVMDGKRKCPTLKINPAQAEVVRMIFDMYVNQDLGRPTIANTLDNLGIPAPRGKRWSAAGLKDLLENVHYIGKVKWNWRKTEFVVEDSEIKKTRPKSKLGEYLIYDGKHPPIISEDLFNAARAKQKRNHRAKASTKLRNPFAALLYCQCGTAMTYRTYKTSDGSERSLPRLACNDQSHCGTGSCLYEDVLQRVCKLLESSIEDFAFKLKNANDQAAFHNDIIKNLEKKLKEIEAKELAQWEAQANPDLSMRMPPEIFRRLNEKLLAEKDEVQQALRNAYAARPAPINYREKIVQFQAALDALRNPAVDAQQKNRLLKTCLERIEYSREKPERIPGQHKRITINGRRTTTSPLSPGAHWTNPPIDLKVTLKI